LKSSCGEPMNFNDFLFLELDSILVLLCLPNMQGKQNKVFYLQCINQFQFIRFPLESHLVMSKSLNFPELAGEFILCYTMNFTRI
jgi:hypothetical protein